MHPQLHGTPSGLWSVLLGLALGGVAFAQPPTPALAPAGTAPPAQPGTAPPAQPVRPGEPARSMRGNAILVTTDGTQRMQMTTKKRIATVLNERETIARVAPLATDPTTVLITGLEPGMTRMTLTDA